MDSPAATAGSTANDDSQRVKFLCSFSGSILPRPLDGKPRYVGGETRIVCVPRDITFEELMVKMRELLEGATLLKYQQPDEDLDALVSVVNDDDVTNMMDEYDKLCTRDGFTRLRIFLFSHPDQDCALHFGDSDERDNERRYVDALNNLNDSPEFRKYPAESLSMGSFDDLHIAEQYFNQMSVEGSFHGQRNMELPMAQMNLRHLNIPHLGAGQSQIPGVQRYNEMEAPYSPGFYSPRHHGNIDQRQFSEFRTSPSSSHCRTPYRDFPDKTYHEEYGRPPINAPTGFEHQPQYADNMVLLSTGPVVSEKAGFPCNILQGSGAYEGNGFRDHSRMSFQRNPIYTESSSKPGDRLHFENSNMGHGYIQAPGSCSECPPNAEMYFVGSDANVHPVYYCKDPTDSRFIPLKVHGHERGWTSSLQQSPWPAEESRAHFSVSGKLADGYAMENGSSGSMWLSNFGDGNQKQLPYILHEDRHYGRSGIDYSSQMLQDQTVVSGSQIHQPSIEERGPHYVNPSAYRFGDEDLYRTPQSLIPSQILWRNGSLSCEPSASPQPVNGSVNAGFIRCSIGGSSSVQLAMENPNTLTESSQETMGFDGSIVPGHFDQQAVKLMPDVYPLENRCQYSLDLVNSAPEQTVSCPSAAAAAAAAASIVGIREDAILVKSVEVLDNRIAEGSKEAIHGNDAKSSGVCCITDSNSDVLASSIKSKSNVQDPSVQSGNVKINESNINASENPESSSCLGQAVLSSTKEVSSKGNPDTNLGDERSTFSQERAQNDAYGVDANVGIETDLDNENLNQSKIEPTKAEAEAIDQGLQTIKNEDLEEIRELGSGTYGAVYHGKWKGSDVAIKRIKASCFAGKPSERERLIADFWKEALILSSLHHPNVVSFYGVVRDGDDGSLATVTEFMVNGSLKQFLQKKDRTIDRRKRLLIAMDTAFGMEYLHGKNIVHFDLKCENLLVNMRDPHRPVCKIGDLGLSKVKQHTLVSGGVRGTLPWMAPELLSGKSNMVTEKIDVYSFGVVMWELLTGDEPYAEMHCASIIGGIVNNTLRPQIPTWCDPEWKSLMESCWASDPSQRPSFSEISQRLRNMAAAINLK